MSSSSQVQLTEVSVSMTIVLVFVTHSVVNLILLMPWNSIRCSFWNVFECTTDEHWMLNWLAFGRFHVLALLMGLVRTSMGNYILEQRLLVGTSWAWCLLSSNLAKM